MLALEVLGGVVVLLGLAFVLARNGSGIEDEPDDGVDSGLPVDRPVRSDDIPRLRFRIGLRGYRMSDVDAALDALQSALAAAERRAAGDTAPPTAEQPQSAAADES
jgi:DivIVA domain-containing protein